MCGFCGFTGQIVDRERYMKEMADCITHRGPDSDGYYFDDDIAMAFRVLLIWKPAISRCTVMTSAWC